MRKFFVLFLLTILMVSCASAAVLTTARPFGKGKWVGLGTIYRDANLNNQSPDFTLTTFGGAVGYGITDNLDFYAVLGTAASSTLTTSIVGFTIKTDVAGSGYGINLKYVPFVEGKRMPFSLAVSLGYKTASLKQKNVYSPFNPFQPTEIDKTQTNTSIAVNVSKLIAFVMPYGALSFRKNTEDGGEASNQLDVTLGSAIAWSYSGAVFVEYTNQSITPVTGSNYTSGQIAIAVGYKFN